MALGKKDVSTRRASREIRVHVELAVELDQDREERLRAILARLLSDSCLPPVDNNCGSLQDTPDKEALT